MDKEWYVQTWEWCRGQGPNSQIKNNYIRLLFSNVSINDIQKTITQGDEMTIIDNLSLEEALANVDKSLEHVDFNTDRNIQKLRKGLLFSKALISYDNELQKLITMKKGIDAQTNQYLTKRKQITDSAKALQSDAHQELSELEDSDAKPLLSKLRGYVTSLIDIIKKVDDELKPNDADRFFQSEKLLHTSETDRIIDALNTDVVFSNRDVLGRYRVQTGNDDGESGGTNRRSNRGNSRNNSEYDDMSNKTAYRVIKDAGGDDLLNMLNRISREPTINKSQLSSAMGKFLQDRNR